MHSTLRKTNLIKIDHIIGDMRKGIRGKTPMGHSKFYQLVAEGVMPQPVKIGRSSFWVEEEIDQAIDNIIKKQREEMGEEEEIKS